MTKKVPRRIIGGGLIFWDKSLYGNGFDLK